jgi:hypothetical protein
VTVDQREPPSEFSKLETGNFNFQNGII